MKVEIWSDFTCPYCYIGIRRLYLALEQFENRQFVDIEFKSYQLDSHKTSETTDKTDEMFMKNQELSVDKIDEIRKQAKEVDLTIQFDRKESVNTFNAHRLAKYAQKQAKELDVIKLLYKKYFTDNKNIGKREILLSIAKEVGLNEEEVDALLCLNNYGKAVQTDEQIAKEIGINGIPFYIFNEQYALSGVQPIHVFLSVLEEVWEEAKDQVTRKKQTEQSENSYCTGNDCE